MVHNVNNNYDYNISYSFLVVDLYVSYLQHTQIDLSNVLSVHKFVNLSLTCAVEGGFFIYLYTHNTRKNFYLLLTIFAYCLFNGRRELEEKMFYECVKVIFSLWSTNGVREKLVGRILWWKKFFTKI